jgi:hypothetical protein
MVDTTVLILSLLVGFLALGRSIEAIHAYMMSLELRSERSATCGETVGLQMARGVVCIATNTSSTSSSGTPST